MKLLQLSLAVVLLAACGCIRLEQSFALKEDGSGSLDVSYSMTDQSLTQLKAMRKLRDELLSVSGKPEKAENSTTDLITLFLLKPENEIKAFFAGYKEQGITLKEFTMDERSGGRRVEFTVNYRSLAEIAKTEFFEKHGFSLTKNKDGDYVFYRSAMNKGQQNRIDLSNSENIKLVAPFLRSFQTKIRISLPGQVLRTNAPSKSGYSAIWDFDFESDPESFMTLQTRGLGIVFEGAGLDLPEIKRQAEQSREG